MIGSRERRQRGDLFLTGAVDYVADIAVPGTVHAAILRSPHAHARIRSIDTSAVDALLVLTGEQAAALHEPLRHFLDPGGLGGNHADVRALAVGKAIYAGQPVVAVVAETAHDAEAQLERIVVDWEPLPAVVDAEEALAPGAPTIHDGWPDNVVVRGRYEDGDVAAAFAAADHVLAGELRLGRATTAPIETRGYLAVHDGRHDAYTVYASTQNPHPLRWTIAESLGVPESQVRIVTPAIGGSFGLKMHGHPEEVLICLLARLAGRPVRWIESRAEALLFGGREQVHRFRVAFDGDGTIRGLEDDYIANVGAVYATAGWGMARLTGLSFPTGYRLRDARVAYTVVTTNKGPWQASRGFGKEATNVVMERILDLVARATGLDCAEVRRRNFVRADEFPWRTTSGLNLDSGDYHAALDKALALVGYEELRGEQARAAAGGRLLGIGIAFELTPEAASGVPGQFVFGFESATVKMDSTGTVTVLTGVASPGNANDTGIAQIVGHQLGLPLERIRVVQGDTDLCPYGFGNYSGRSIVLGGGAAALAARDVRAKVARVAASMLEANADDLVFADGRVGVDGRSVTIAEVARAIHQLRHGSHVELELPLEATRTYRPENFSYEPDEKGRIQPYPTYSSAVHVAAVEVDRETGKVELRRYGVLHDCGTMINPTFVEGQMHGGAVMGIGAALLEEVGYTADGRPAAVGWKTYLMPRSLDVPEILLGHQVTPSPFTLLGAKGAGEAGVGGGEAAVVNAVADALAAVGATVEQTPLTPPRVLRALRAASSEQGSTSDA